MRYMKLAVICFSLCLSGIVVFADGMMLPVRPEIPAFSVKYHRVNVTIDRQIATTEVDQAFHNEAASQVEGSYLFPIADNMAISKFSMYTGDEELTHRVLEKDEARRIYTGIVAQRRDPALLEWLGYRMIQARVFPIEAHGDKRIRIAYQEVLPVQNNVVKYVYPLKTEKVSSKPLAECSVTVHIVSARPLRNVYSPTHNVTVQYQGEYRATVTYSEKQVLPDEDLVLYYTLSAAQVGVDLLTYRDPDRGDGYFLLLAAPNPDVRKGDVQPKDVIFVLDTSGSMSGHKIEQAKAALVYCVNSLDPHDRFNLIIFNTEIVPWMKALQPAARTARDAAVAFIGEQRANGGTNLNGAIQTALDELHDADTTRPHVAILLTDGQPTVGETNTEALLTNAKTKNTHHARFFDFGVGADYNAHLLDTLADDNGGYAENVLPKENIEVKVSDFYNRIASPLFMNLKLDWGEANIYDVYPQELPDLYQGSQLVLAGRYKPLLHGSTTTIHLDGEVAGRRQTFTYTAELPARAEGDDAVPRLWATRKIGFLEDQIRLHGANKELVEELVQLSKTYGILTQYTSFLVDVDVNAPAGPRALNAFKPLKDTYTPQEQDKLDALRDQKVGSSAVAQSVNSKAALHALQFAPRNGNMIISEAGDRMQLAQLRNINQRSFVQNGRQWVDLKFNTQRVVKVKAYSPAYFQLANANPRMAQFMSVGENVIVAMKNVAVQVDTAGREETFSDTDFLPLKKDMDDEFGVPKAMATGVPLAMITAPTSTTLRPWVFTLLALLAIPFALVFRRRIWRGKDI